jgi:hypothetical protein
MPEEGNTVVTIRKVTAGWTPLRRPAPTTAPSANCSGPFSGVGAEADPGVWKSSGRCVPWGELSSEPHGSVLTIEFIAARRPQTCGARGSPLGEASSPAALTVLISDMSRIPVMDETPGPAHGHQEVRDTRRRHPRAVRGGHGLSSVRTPVVGRIVSLLVGHRSLWQVERMKSPCGEVRRACFSDPHGVVPHRRLAYP